MNGCNLHELWLMILANICFSNKKDLNKFVDRIVDLLPPEDIHFLVKYLRRLGVD